MLWKFSAEKYNSMENFRGKYISMEFHGKFHGIPRKIPWNSAENKLKSS